ncbi:hypothetical protein T05_13595 [Trichinella murrelli]|uniref:Uncharacterized protein n=1 Tax=Trichinella murrelli TaxID=144512 RepID=A0A0V0TC22_9BILA|nr:hypothetical protein T05_13595 [Trichinella murrelli]
MLILGVTRVSFTESFAIDASGLDRMNNSRSPCVIIKSNLVTCCLGGFARSQRTADSTTTSLQHFRSDQELLIRSEMCEMNYANIPHLNMIIRCGHSRMCQVRLCSRLIWKFPRGMPPAMPKATPRATSF